MKSFFSRIKNAWPDTLFGRLVLIWLLTFLIGHVLEIGASYTTVLNYQTTKSEYYLSKDIALLVPALEHAQPSERALWLQRMERQDYRYELGAGAAANTIQLTSTRAKEISAALSLALDSRYLISVTAPNTPKELMVLHLPLSDGTPLTIHLNKIALKMPWWGGAIFATQILFLIILTWYALRQAMRPLLRLAEASEALGSSLQCEPIIESGPSEVARAAVAFNAMQRRITEHLAERVHILASISHDLQTPITRMRLRADLLDNGVDNGALRDKLHGDLNAMQVLVEEGIAYARSAHSVNEVPCRVDIDALLDSLTCDYLDDGQQIGLQGKANRVITTRPHALRRIVSNLVDNALKFAEQVEISVMLHTPNLLNISVQDRGPGIPATELDAVLKPFYRLEASRNRSSGGTGLGLAIAQQLSIALGGTLSLSNRDGGGLQATISLPC
ncbi:ATP-binding protein [Solimicrobium silvestre]|uniref:histidine kinase n=1 Tax=Solimicrobium silvestre TaxID=2099400 RepID=A0A2S9GVN8_9BURK|nr:HAMP domain-containing sensor histidine kinase [Solimicrobium silvestre]PRC91771.1 Signal transduction histidine kinase [Solimicrobium silvestre]